MRLSCPLGSAPQAFIRAKYEARAWAAGDWPPPEALAEPEQVCTCRWRNSVSHREGNRPWHEQAGLMLQGMLRKLCGCVRNLRARHIGHYVGPCAWRPH